MRRNETCGMPKPTKRKPDDWSEAEDAIAANPLTPRRVQMGHEMLEGCTYATTALLALAEALASLDDHIGARMLRGWAEELREHEATTV